MEIKSISEINHYSGNTINPLNTPDKVFELYSVPSFDQGFPEIIKGADIGSSKNMIEENDVLICKINPRINRVWVVKHNTEHQLLASSEWIVVRNRDIDSDYLKWYFSSPSFRNLITSHVAGIGGSLTRAQPKQVATYPVPIPEHKRQLHISATLSKISNLISLRKRQLAKLDELVKARSVEMFGDIISNNMKWAVAKLADISSSRLGKMLDAKQQTGENTYPYLANFNVQWFRFNLSNLNSMDFNEADQKEFSLIDGDLMVTEGGEVGRCAVWHNNISPCFFQKAIHRVRCDTTKILPDYLSWWFKIHADYNAFEDVVGGVTSIAHLPGVKLKNLDVVIPPLEFQNQFVKFVEQVNKTKSTVQRGLDKLETLKKALMQEYFG